jgi:hypothetical protein
VARFDRVIPPGEEGEIVATMDTSKYRGSIAKSVKVVSSDPVQASAQLTLKANVHSWMEVLPSWSANLTSDLGQGARKILYLKSPDKDVPLAPPTAESNTGLVTATVEKIQKDSEEAARGDYRLVVELSPKAPAGPLGGKIKLTSAKRSVYVTVAGRVHGPISVLPMRLNLIGQPADSGRPSRLSGIITLVARPDQPEFQIQEIQSNDDRLKLEPIPDPDKRRHRIAARWTAREVKGDFQGTIRITTDHPTMPEIQVPFRVRIL